MSRSSLAKKFLLFGGLGVAALLYSMSGSAARPTLAATKAVVAQADDAGAYVPASAADEHKAWAAKIANNTLSYEPAALCAGCHVTPTTNGNNFVKLPGFDSPATDFVLLTEYSIWKVHDKHAQAYAVLEGERGKEMAKLMGFDSATDPKAGCMSCHGMYNLPGTKPGFELEKQDGVSCGGCHGPSSVWRGKHTGAIWRNLSPQEKMEDGLRDLRNPEVRARLCMSCHIGNAAEGKVVSHAMFAAGHPPLPPIEIATFSQNEPQHWREAKKVPYFIANKDDKAKLAKFNIHNLEFHRTRMALVGAIVSLRETMQLAHDRASFNNTDFKANPGVVWPEVEMKNVKPVGTDKTPLGQAKARWPEIAMAHTDCFACHHDLRYPGYRQVRGFGFQLPGLAPVRAIPGRPMIRTWSLGLVQPTLLTAGEQDRAKALRTKLEVVMKGLNVRPFGPSDKIESSTVGVVGWCDDALKEMRGMKLDSAKALKLMHALCDLKGPNAETPYLPDYETARQIASLLKVVYEDWKGAGGSATGAELAINELATSVDTEPYVERDKRTKAILKIVKDDPGAAKTFLDYVQNVGNIELLKPTSMDPKARPLQQLMLEISRLDFEKFNKHINSDAMRQILQELGDKEQKQLLKSISDYTPKDFLDKLSKIRAKLPGT